MTFADIIAISKAQMAPQQHQIQKEHVEKETARVTDKAKTEDISDLIKKINAEIEKTQSKKKGFFHNLGIRGSLGELLDSDIGRGLLSFAPGGRLISSTLKGIESEREARHQKDALSNILEDPKYKMLTSGTYLSKPISNYLSDVKTLKSEIDPTLSAIAGFGKEFGTQSLFKKGGELFKGGDAGAETFGVKDILKKDAGPFHNLVANIKDFIPEGETFKSMINNMKPEDLKELSENLTPLLSLLEMDEGQPVDFEAGSYFSGMNY